MIGFAKKNIHVCTTSMYICHCKVQASKTQIGTNFDIMYISLHWIDNNPFNSNP